MDIINNIIDFARQSFGMGTTHNGARDLWEVFGYPDKVDIKDFREKYKRGDIATRIVDAYPNACWSNKPDIVEDADTPDNTPWEKSVIDLFKELDFWKHIKKLDKLVNLGSYAVLYIGFADAKQLDEPVMKGTKPIYLKPLAQDVARVKSYVDDAKDKRFGMPLIYELQLRDGKTVLVHHTRVLHVAERTLDDETNGMGILEFIWNKLIDLEKISGGSAETFWLNSRGGLSLEADADTEIGDEDAKKAMKEEVDNYQHNLSRIIKTRGIKINPINSTIASPEYQFSICVSLIAGATAIPKRILLGNEAGELASTQDENNWNNQIKDRQVNFCETDILNRFVDYMVALGIIKALAKDKDYSWEWPSLVSLSEQDKADIASKKTQAIAAYANSPTAETIIPPQQFVEEILEMEYREDEVNKIIEEENRLIDESLKEDPSNGNRPN